MPTKIISGKNCVVENYNLISALGHRCLIITGSSSAKKSGALFDVLTALEKADIKYAVYDGVEQNPLISSCKTAGKIAFEMNADFIIGIGGGSPLDAAKGASIFAANPNLSTDDLYDKNWLNKPLKTVMIGTTAGTGSEVGRYSVLTIDETHVKRSVADDSLIPSLTFADPKYTYSLPLDFTISTAIDALAHSIEGYFSKSAGDISDIFALRAMGLIYPSIKELYHISDVSRINEELRERLFYGSLYAGVTLGHTGTCFPHAISYVLTEEFSTPHGYACGLFMPDFLRHSEIHLKEKAERLAVDLNCGISEISELISALCKNYRVKISDDIIDKHFWRYINNKNFLNSPGNFSENDAALLLKNLK